MSDYTADHASALADVQAAGLAVTFSLTESTQDATTESFSAVTTSSVSGYAIQDYGSEKSFRAQGLITADQEVLFFIPSTIGDVPEVGSSCTFGLTVYTAKMVKPFAPNGTAIAIWVVVSV